MLFPELLFGEIFSALEVSRSLPKVPQNGQQSQAQLILLYALFEIDAPDTQLVRKLGLSIGGHALSLLPHRYLFR